MNNHTPRVCNGEQFVLHATISSDECLFTSTDIRGANKSEGNVGVECDYRVNFRNRS